MPSFKKRRTDSCITDLTTDSDNDESPLAVALLESATPTASGRPTASGWLGGRHGSLRGGGGGGGEGGGGGGGSAGGGGGRGRRGRGRGQGEGGRGGVRPTQGKISDFVSSINGSGSHVRQDLDTGFESSQRPQTSSLRNPYSHAPLNSSRNFHFVPSMESSLPPLRSLSPRKRTQTNQDTTVSTRCTVATMNYPQALSDVEEGARQRLYNKDAPIVGRTRDIEQRSTKESRRSGNSSDDVMVIELPSDDKRHWPLSNVGTMGSLRTVSQETDVRRSSRSDRSHRYCDSTVHSSQLSHQCNGASGTRARTMQSAVVGRGNDQSLGLENDVTVLSSPVQTHSSGNVKQSNADRVGSRMLSSSAVSTLQSQSVGLEKDRRREIDEFSPIQRLCYELSPGLQCTDGTSNEVGSSGSSVMVSKPDSAGSADVVCIGSDSEDNCSYVATTSVYFEPKKNEENLERNDWPECSIVSRQNHSLSSGVKGAAVPLSNSLVREKLRSSSAGNVVAASQSTHGSYRPLLATPTSSGVSEAYKQTSDAASSNRGFTPMPSTDGHVSHTTTDRERQLDTRETWFNLPSPPTDPHPLPTSGKVDSALTAGRMREGKGQSEGLLPNEESHCDLTVVEVGDRGTISDDDFEKPKRKHRNRFAISESSRKEKSLVFSRQSRATPSGTPSRPPRKEGSILETTPRKNTCSKPGERSVFDHLPRGSQHESASPLLPTPLASSPRLTIPALQKIRRTSEDEVVFQGEEVKKKYPLRSRALNLSSAKRDWYSDHEEPSEASQKRGTGFAPSSQSSSSSNTRSFYGPSLPSYGLSMLDASKQRTKGGLPQSYRRHLDSIQVPKLKSRTANAEAQGKRKFVQRQRSSHYTLKDELDNVQLEVSTAQVGRLDKINVLSTAELMGHELKLNLDIDDKTQKIMIDLPDIAEWKMNLSSEPMLVALTLREGPARKLANRLSTSFHLDPKFYNPKSEDESEKFVIFHLVDTPPPKTIVQLNEILDGAKASCVLTMTIDKELDPTEATELLKRVQPSKPARTSTAATVQQLTRDLDALTGRGAVPRRSTRMARKSKGEEVVRRRKGNPNKKLLSYKPAGSKLSLEIVDADLDCLCQGEYLNDKIIDFYLMYLYNEVLGEGHRSRVHIFNSFFHTRLKDSSRDNHKLSTPERIHDRVKTWTRHVDLFSKDYIVLPVCDRAHWFVAFICYPGLFNPDDVIKHQPKSKRVVPTRSKRGRTALKKGRKPRTPKGAIVLSDSSQEELEGPDGGDEGEAPLPKNDWVCERGEGEGVEGDELLDMVEFSECGDGGEVVERGEAVVPGAVLQDAAEREVEEMEGDGSECVQAVTETSAITLQGLEDSLDVPDNQTAPDSEMVRGEGEMEVGHGDSDLSEDDMTSVRRNGRTVCPLDSESDGEEGAPGEDAPLPHSQDMETLTDADIVSRIKMERTEEEENVVCISSVTEDTAKEPCIIVLDSLGVRRIGIVKRIREYLTVEWRTKKKDLPFKEFNTMRVLYPKVLLQDNSSDCGLFLLQYVESLFTSIKEGHPLPSTPQAWADYSQTNIKRDIIRTIILDLSEKQSLTTGT